MEQPASTHRQSNFQWDLFAGLLPLLALSPLLVYQAADLWSRDHRQFFPIALAALVAIVIWKLRRATLADDFFRMWIAVCCLSAAAVVYGYAVWIFSPWLAHLAFVVVFSAWALGRLGHKHWGGVAGLIVLLASTLPWPWGWDEGFSNWLQSSAAWCSAKALDALAIPCLQNGSLVETRDMQIIADELCGGLASVYAYISFAIVICLLQHCGLLVGLKTVLLTPLWTLFGFFLRIFGALTVQEYLGRDVSNGWDFRILELATSGLVLLLIWTTSRFLKRLYEPIPVADAEFGPVFSGLNKLFCWPQPDPFEELEPDDEYERQRFRKRKEELIARRRARTGFQWTRNSEAVWSVRVAAGVLLICGLLPASTLAKQGFSQLSFGLPTYSISQVESLGEQDSLPAQLDGGWQRQGFQIVQRNPRSRQGEFSLVWRYRLEDRQFDASLDLPFLGWHAPATQLELQGWQIERIRVNWDDDWPWTETRLENELGGKAIILHALITSDGQPYTYIPSQLLDDQPLKSEPDSPISDSTSAQPATEVTYQFQLFSETGGELPTDQLRLLHERFLQLRKTAIALVK
jgi:hypothetical protein